MLILEGYGITLRSLNENSVEQLRQWRNQTEIRQWMQYQKLISKEEQQKWFKQLDSSSAYFIIYYGQVAIGMTHLSQIQKEEKIADAGLFIADLTFHGTGVSLGASLLLLNYAFNQLELEKVTAKVAQQNKKAIQYNELLGFQLEQELNKDFLLFTLDKAIYKEKKTFLEKLASINYSSDR